MSVSVKQAKISLTYKGSPRRCYSATSTSGPAAAISQCSLVLNPEDGPVKAGDEVECALGYQIGGVNQVFKGAVDEDGMDFFPWWVNVRCSGELRKTNRRVNKEDPSATETPTTGIFPVAVDEGP